VGNLILCDSQNRAFPSDVGLANCILRGQGPQVYTYDSTTVTIRYTDVAGGQSQAASPSSGLTWGPGNTSADPQFTAPSEDNYRLKPSSPCIDAGDPDYAPEAHAIDLDGNPRVVGGRVDMGAYEFQGI
jgi:hypothetical protein